MNSRIRCAAWLLATAAAPLSTYADDIQRSDAELTAFATFSAQGVPDQHDFAANSGPFVGLPIEAKALVRTGGLAGLAIPFPNLPTSQTQAFASSAVDTFGFFGVGVSGFFFGGSLPPNALAAGGAFSRTFTNDSELTQSLNVSFFIPAPTLRLFGNIGDFFPAGADPARDANASVEVRMLAKVTHPDGTIDDAILLDYGLRLLREPVSGALDALPLGPLGSVERFDEPDGSFGFRLPDLKLVDFRFVDMDPGDVEEFSYDFFAQASTGFGETAVFAASGDPFDLSAGGGVDLQVGAAAVAAPVPEPGIWALFGAGLVALRRALRGASRPAPAPRHARDRPARASAGPDRGRRSTTT
ncbi:MAG: hypothetical protein ACREXI_15810 [Caldimonas sp.]